MDWLIPTLALVFLGSLTVFIVTASRARTGSPRPDRKNRVSPQPTPPTDAPTTPPPWLSEGSPAPTQELHGRGEQNPVVPPVTSPVVSPVVADPVPVSIPPTLPIVVPDDSESTVYGASVDAPLDDLPGEDFDPPTISPIPPWFEVVEGQYETAGRRILLMSQSGSMSFPFRRAPDRRETFPPNLILLRSVQVSRDQNAHGEFLYERVPGGTDRYLIRNYGAYDRNSNPVYVQGRMLVYGEQVPLSEGDIVKLGDVLLRFHARGHGSLPSVGSGNNANAGS